ncbi:hypothetical protein NL676_011648 [Syzygium grande]|nr:hypothetical protein NL676_011648 [Syzygium grande]
MALKNLNIPTQNTPYEVNKKVNCKPQNTHRGNNILLLLTGWLMVADGVPDCADINKLRVNEFRNHLDPALSCPGNKPSEDTLCWFGAIVGGLTSSLQHAKKDRYNSSPETGLTDLVAKFLVLCSKLVVLASEFS